MTFHRACACASSLSGASSPQYGDQRNPDLAVSVVAAGAEVRQLRPSQLRGAARLTLDCGVEIGARTPQP
jgi:hypothetical protein